MPFITEEIWQQVAPIAGVDGDTIMLRRYPEPRTGADDASAVADIEWVRRFILGVRQIRGEMDISPGKALPVLLAGAGNIDRERAVRYLPLLQRVGRVESVSILEPGAEAPASATALLDDVQLLVPMKGLIDVDAERARLDKQVQRLEAERKKSRGKLGNEKFVNNAPPAVVTQERERLTDFERQLEQLAAQRKRLEAIG